MGNGVLGSDHVNYLVYRYLQESGFEHSAKSLFREWYRRDDFHDPEALPFTPVVKQFELVRIIQDGLFHDQLQASVTNSRRKYLLTATDLEDQLQVSKQKSFSRRQSTYAAGEQDDFPVPPPKRVRSGNADVVTNGDAMDIDDKPDDEERASVAPSEQDRDMSEQPAQAEPVETRGATTQTEQVKMVRTRSNYASLNEPAWASILHCAWSPSSGPARLFMAGESMCRLHDMSAPDREEFSFGRPNLIGSGAEDCVTAAAWHPGGHHITCAVKSSGPTEETPYTNYLLDVDSSSTRRIHEYSFDMFVMALRYSPSGRILFTVSTDGQDSYLQALKRDPVDDTLELAATYSLPEATVLELICISETDVALAGRGLFKVMTLVQSESKEGQVGLRFATRGAYPLDKDLTVDKLAVDSVHSVIIGANSVDSELFALQPRGDLWQPGPPVTLPEGVTGIVSSLAVQPRPDTPTMSKDVPSKLAIAITGSGLEQIYIYDLSETGCTSYAKLHIGPQEPPLILAWAPPVMEKAEQKEEGGSPTPAQGPLLLAAASDEAIRVWDLSGPVPRDHLWWKAEPAEWYLSDEHHLPNDDDMSVTEPALAWDATGRRLAYAMGRRIAIVSQLDDEADGDEDVQMDGPAVGQQEDGATAAHTNGSR